MQKWKTISSKMAFNHKWFKLRQDKVELPNGKILDEYFLWLKGYVALIVPITEDGKFVLVRQYKHGADEIIIEFPAGFIDGDETPEEAAQRELQEETGYSSDNLQLLSTAFADPTKAIGKIYIYLAKNAVRNKAIKLDETEDIEVLVKSEEEVLEMITKGEICVNDSVAGFFLALEALKK
ncbi:MAG TPA: NUDIX hydrolase [Candidatus Moranbacteria bacterium]|nr:NUDIX hydrolase [Candidatus Moranbacteria bacterium]